MTRRETNWTPGIGRRVRHVDTHRGSRVRSAWLLLIFALFGITGACTLIMSRPLQ